MYLRTCSSSKPTVDTAYPRAQRCSPVKFRSLPHKRAIAMALFPFRNPITEATGYFGGIAIHLGEKLSPGRLAPYHSCARCSDMPRMANQAASTAPPDGTLALQHGCRPLECPWMETRNANR